MKPLSLHARHYGALTLGGGLVIRGCVTVLELNTGLRYNNNTLA